MAKVAILGYGTVGSGVAKVFDVNHKEVAATAGENIEVKYILDLREFPGDVHEKQIVHDYDTILNDPEIEVICETMGGIEPAFTFEKKALAKGISVATSNKELVAVHGAELVALAKQNNCSYLFEASVGGGIPILRALNTSLRHEKIDTITGILNGTTNYMLTCMDRDGADFDDVLKQAQDKGYAERNPEADIEGYDACRKTAILASLLNGGSVNYKDIHTEGITGIDKNYFVYAHKLHMAVKLIGMVKKDERGLFAMVAPFMIPDEHSLSGVNMVFNAIDVHSNMLGNTMFYGKGAGKEATASAVVSDMIYCVQHKGRHIDVNLSDKPVMLQPDDGFERRFFVRTKPEDKKIAAELFGAITEVSTDKVQGEYAFITPVMTEGEFMKKVQKLDASRKFIRIL